MNAWTLPDTAEIGGRTYHINADFRDVVDIISRLTDPNEDEQVRLYVALSLFYDGFSDMPESDLMEAVKWMYSFISYGEEDEGQPHPKSIDWEQDRAIIVSDVNKVAGCEVRALPFCHWWTFLAWFNAIGDGQLATVVSIREKRRKGKPLADWEREYYRANRSKIDFKTNYTDTDNDVLNLWGAK